MSKYAHKEVARYARHAAADLYDELAKDNEWYALNPSRRNFIKRISETPEMIKAVRQSMAEALERHDLTEAEKQEIYDALMLDSTLPRGAGLTMH